MTMRFIIFGLYALILAFPLAEAVIYPGITLNKLNLQPYIIVLLGVVLSFVLRYFTNKKNWEPVGWWFLYIAAPLITLACLGLRYVEVYTHPNYIFSNFHISLTQSEQLAWFIVLLALPFVDKSYFKKNLPLTMVAISIYLLHIILLTWSFPDIYIAIKKEDALIEYMTFFAYFLASLLSLFNLRFIQQLTFSQQQKNILKVLSIVMALGLLIIAGEEISWGQRIANIEIHETLQAANTQGELNLHNNRMVFGFVYQAYTFLNLYGLLSWLAYKPLQGKLPKIWKIVLRLVTSRWYLMIFFIPNLIYVSLMPYYISSLDLQWEEVTEVYLAVGIMMWMIANLDYLRRKALKIR